ncbi:glutathione S-transferase N-terminal domain-containing protein [Terasakiella sp. A23]|uniref:glutathione S-transferase family protein n=1 Tax=Terasakiella sp. FCG-A23 TaxID=3080561 RepID=UPI00295594E8|nr:glutathione S-transferase N-terminal domain-containing protein [Terasakiella sp. A23]MDV7341740.1 glutathione S-transferase N-terminal domain-containing protein [Terasakiella sp. A23]
MIDLYSWPTPNGHKVHVMLEEVGLDYRVHGIDIAKGHQFLPEFLEISPNNKIPAIVDHDGPNGERFTLFESGAILMYLAEKTGSDLFPTDTVKRYKVMEWLMFQMGSIGPMLGQAHHFRIYAPEQVDYGIERYTKEATRLYGVMDKRLGEEEYLAGDYSIADIACLPWIRSYKNQGQVLEDYPNLKRWFLTLKERPAVRRGLAVLDEKTRTKAYTKEELKLLFNVEAK